MTEQPQARWRRKSGLAVLAGVALAAVGVRVVWRTSNATPVTPRPPEESAELAGQIHEFCGACHVYPPPETFPREEWAFEVSRGFRFAAETPPSRTPPPLEAVVRYYETRASLELPPADIAYATTPPPVSLKPTNLDGPPAGMTYATADVNMVHLYDQRRLDILACDFGSGAVMVLRPYEADPKWRVLAELSNPAHAEVVDLDGDGVKDILVADLGNLQPTDRLCGRVVWLRGHEDGTFSERILLQDVGRVADVQAADFRGTGKLDLVVAEFGLLKAGSIRFLENHTTDWDAPDFVPSVLDPRHGAIHVPTIELNGDDKPDFIALISQEHETVVAFLNRGDGTFHKESIHAPQQPGYGSSGIRLVDMNGDRRLDVLYTNGDTMDMPAFLRPYHSVQWLENPGDGSFPWKRHPIGPMYGVHRAAAADVDGDGRIDVAAVSFLPEQNYPQRKTKHLDAVVLFHQTPSGTFDRYVLEAETCNHLTCAFGDVTGRGRSDLVVGNFAYDVGHPVTIWRQADP